VPLDWEHSSGPHGTPGLQVETDEETGYYNQCDGFYNGEAGQRHTLVASSSPRSAT
jgi:hypothetical protein